MPSERILAKKKQFIDELATEFSGAQSIVFAEYRGLTVAQDTEMRTAMREAGVVYRVIKNTMSVRALAQIGIEGLDEVLKGPTAIAFSKDDMISPARLLKEHSRKYDKLKIKGGILEGQVISLEEVDRLASIPSREVLLSQLVFTLLSPITGLAIALNAIKDKDQEPAEAEPAAVATTAEDA